MESGAGTAVNPHALLSAAQHLDAAADHLRAALDLHLRFLHLDGPAGVRGALQRLVADVDTWRQAAGETASALRSAADRYTAAEDRATAALR